MSNISSMRGGRSRKFKSEINVVPYIDVMLVLLVIFMVVAPLSTPSMINLPKAGKSNQPPTEYLEIELKPDGSATVGVHGKKYPDLPLMISADKDIKYDEVVQTISQANKTGIARVGLSTR
jgi:biopolymer transport protein TolR